MKAKIVLLIISLTVMVSVFLLWRRPTPAPQTDVPRPTTPTLQQDDSPRIVSTKPDPLEEAIISSSEVLEITFNKPLENEGELKIRIDPKVDFEIKLSQDRKTGKIIPKKPYELGATYTLFIGPDSKFEGVGEWKQEKIYHFKTVKYRGV